MQCAARTMLIYSSRIREQLAINCLIDLPMDCVMPQENILWKKEQIEVGEVTPELMHNRLS